MAVKKKVALIGLAPGWDEAPWDDPTWERWSLNDGYLLFGPNRHCDSWWELHGDTPLTRARRPPGHFDRIRKMDIPVYYLHGDPPTPAAIKLDTDQLARVWRDYFACTNAYQIALAIAEGFTDIAVYGMPLLTNREVVVERPCVTAWLAYAEGRGVTVHDHSDLLTHPARYALDDAVERQAVFLKCWQHAGSLLRWLPYEASRLAIHQHQSIQRDAETLTP